MMAHFMVLWEKIYKFIGINIFLIQLQLEVTHTLCWSVPLYTPLDIGFLPYFKS
jgi:hypothetical protein